MFAGGSGCRASARAVSWVCSASWRTLLIFSALQEGYFSGLGVEGRGTGPNGSLTPSPPPALRSLVPLISQPRGLAGDCAGGEGSESYSFRAIDLSGVTISLSHFTDAENSFGEGCVPPHSWSRALLPVVAFKGMEVWKPVRHSPQLGCSPLGYVAFQTPPLLISVIPNGSPSITLVPALVRHFFPITKRILLPTELVIEGPGIPKFWSSGTARPVNGHDITLGPGRCCGSDVGFGRRQT